MVTELTSSLSYSFSTTRFASPSNSIVFVTSLLFARVPSSSPTPLPSQKGLVLCIDIHIPFTSVMEVKLWNDKREREMYDNFAELYAIVKATERLEKAYVRDIISPQEYELDCQKLIAHFKTLASTLKDTVPSIERFADTYKMDCPAAINRLVLSGVPATVEHRAAAAASASTSAAIVAECVQNFITAMDSLKLNMVAVDQVYPLLSDLYSSLNKLTILPPDFEGKTKMKEWIARLSKMGAADELTEQQARQLHFDLESSYNSFMAALPNAGT